LKIESKAVRLKQVLVKPVREMKRIWNGIGCVRLRRTAERSTGRNIRDFHIRLATRIVLCEFHLTSIWPRALSLWAAIDVHLATRVISVSCIWRPFGHSLLVAFDICLATRVGLYVAFDARLATHDVLCKLRLTSICHCASGHARTSCELHFPLPKSLLLLPLGVGLMKIFYSRTALGALRVTGS
jgi:hypothetical protein